MSAEEARAEARGGGVTNREDLIEKAARILWAEDDAEMETSWPSNASLYRETASKILTVFEQASRPVTEEEVLAAADALDAVAVSWGASSDPDTWMEQARAALEAAAKARRA